MPKHEEAHEACKVLHAAATLDDLTRVVERETRKLLGCEHATFFRIETHDKVTNLVGYRNKGKQRVSFPASEGIAGSVAAEKGFYICNSPKDDNLYREAVDGIPGVEVRSVLATASDAGSEDVGVLQALNAESEKGFVEDDAFWLQLLADHAALACVRLQRSQEGWELVRNLAATVAAAVDNKHVSTVGHCERTRQIALAIGKDMNLSGDELLELELAALLHDIGRLALSPEAFEWAGGAGASEKYASPQERLHVVLTEAILRELRLPEYLDQLPEIALSHHERADGSGFPRGRKLAELPLAARILQAANAFDILTSGRAPNSEGKRMDDEEAAKALKARAGKTYDPAVADRLVRGKLYRIEKRRYPRLEYATPLEVTVLDEAGSQGESKTMQTEAVDISEGGILFKSSRELPARALLKLRMHLPTETLEALARVARHLKDGGGFKVGAYFLWYGS